MRADASERRGGSGWPGDERPGTADSCPPSRKPRPEPKTRAMWLAGAVRKDPAEVIAAAFDEAGARDPGRLRTWVVLVDGAEHQLDLIRAEAARRNADIHVVIDLIHVNGVHLEGGLVPARRRRPRRRGLGRRRALAVLAGDSARAAQDVATGYSQLDPLVARNDQATEALFDPAENADPAAVADEIARILALPVGAKPVRSVIDFTNSGVAEVNAVIQDARENFVERMGYTELLHVRP